MAKDSAAAKRARVKLQLRDKNGRWIEMGGGAKWLDPKSNQQKAGTIVGFDGNFVLVAQKPANATAEPAPMRIPISAISTYAVKANLDPYYKNLIQKYINQLSGKQKKDYDARTEAVNKGKKAIVDGKVIPTEYVEMFDEDDDTDGIMEEITFQSLKDKKNETLQFTTSDGKKWFHSLYGTIIPLEGDGEVVDTSKARTKVKFGFDYANKGNVKVAPKTTLAERVRGFRDFVDSLPHGSVITDGHGKNWKKGDDDKFSPESGQQYKFNAFQFDKEPSNILVNGKEQYESKAQVPDSAEQAPEQEAEWPTNVPQAGKQSLPGFTEADKIKAGTYIYVDDKKLPITGFAEIAGSEKDMADIAKITYATPIIGTNPTTKGKIVGHDIVFVDKDGNPGSTTLYAASTFNKGKRGVYVHDPKAELKSEVQDPNDFTSVKDVSEVPTGTLYTNGAARYVKDDEGWNYYPLNAKNPIKQTDAQVQKALDNKALVGFKTQGTSTKEEPKPQEDSQEQPEAPAQPPIGANQFLKSGVVFTPIADLKVGDEIYPIDYKGDFPAKTPYAHSMLKLSTVNDDQIALTETNPVEIEAIKEGKYATITLPSGNKAYLGWSTYAAKTSDNGTNKNVPALGQADVENKLAEEDYKSIVDAIEGAPNSELANLAQDIMWDLIKPLQDEGGEYKTYSAHRRSLGNKALDLLEDNLVSEGISSEAAKFFVNLHKAGIGSLEGDKSNEEFLNSLETKEGVSTAIQKLGKNHVFVKDALAFGGKSNKDFIASDQQEAAKAFYALERSRKALADKYVDDTPQTPEPEPQDQQGPIDVSNWTKISGPKGSNPGGIYEDETGKRWYVKQSQTDDHARNEVLADNIYAEAGIEAAGLRLADVGGGKLGTASPMIDGAKVDLSSKIHNPAYVAKLREGFGVDAWLANWDVLGLVLDNVITNEQGLPVRIDPGGAMKYRAQGQLKNDLNPKFWGKEVLDWDTLRDPNVGTAAQAFEGMTDDELKNAAKKVQAISPKRIDELVSALDFPSKESAELKDILKARREDIIAKAKLTSDAEDTPELNLSIGAIYGSPDSNVTYAKDYNGVWHEFKNGVHGFGIPESEVLQYIEEEGLKPKEFKKYNFEKDGLYMKSIPNNSVIKKSPTDDSMLIIKDANGKYTKYEKGKSPQSIAFYHFVSELDAWNNPNVVYTESPDIPVIPWTKEEAKAFNKDKDNSDPIDYNNDDNLVELKSPITEKEYEALSEYMGSSYDLNHALRIKDQDSSELWAVPLLDSLLDKSVLKEDTTVYRGLTMTPERAEAHKNSGGHVDLGYMSTSKSKGVAIGFSIDEGAPVLFEINLPKGFHAHPVDYAAADSPSLSNEDEVVLPRGTKFTIEKVEDYTPVETNTKFKGYKFTVSPILDDENYEGANNGTTEETPITQDPDDGLDANPSEGTGGEGSGEDQADSGTSGPAAPEVTPASHTETTYPDKGKIAIGNDGEEFKVNMKVLHSKYGPATIMTILPSTNSAKIITPEGNTYTVGAKKLKGVGTDTPIEAVVETGTDVGDKGIDAQTGKMYLIGKGLGKLFVGSKVSYTKKGETHTGTITNLFPSSQQANVAWDEEGQAPVKKVSQLTAIDVDEKGEVENSLEIAKDKESEEITSNPDDTLESEEALDTYTKDEFEKFAVGSELADGEAYTYIRTGSGEGWVQVDNYYSPVSDINSEDMAALPISKDVWQVSTLQANYGVPDLNGFNEGDELYSPINQMYFEKTEDGSWYSGETASYFEPDELLTIFPDNKWEYIEKIPENNISVEQLHDAPVWSSLTTAEGINADKYDETSWMIDGKMVDADELLSTYPSETWVLEEPVISPDEYTEIGSHIEEATIGSIYSISETPQDSPTSYIKVNKDTWLPYDEHTKAPVGDEEVSGVKNSSLNGYFKVDQEGTGEFPFTKNTIESEASVSKENLTLDFVEALPVGTRMKTDSNSKVIYKKVGDNLWKALFAYTEANKTGTNQQMLKAPNGFEFIEYPKQASPAVSEAPAYGTALPDLDLSSLPENSYLVRTDGFLKTVMVKNSNGSWSSYYNSSYEEKVDFSQKEMEKFQKSPASYSYKYVPFDHEAVVSFFQEYNTDAVTTLKATAEGVVPSSDTSSATVGPPKTLVGLSEEDLSMIPVGTVYAEPEDSKSPWKIFKEDDNKWTVIDHTGTKLSLNYSNKQMENWFNSAYVLQTPDATPEAEPISAPETIGEEMSEEDFAKIPVGAKYVSSSGDPFTKKYSYTKTGDNSWEYNGIFINKSGISDGQVMQALSKYQYTLSKDSNAATETPSFPQDLKNLTKESEKLIPVSTMYSDSDGYTLEKVGESSWILTNDVGSTVANYTSQQVLNAADLGYKIVNTTPSTESKVDIPKDLSKVGLEGEAAIPVGAKYVDPADNWVWEKDGANSWVLKNAIGNVVTVESSAYIADNDLYEYILETTDSEEQSSTSVSSSLPKTLSNIGVDAESKIPVGAKYPHESDGWSWKKTKSDVWSLLAPEGYAVHTVSNANMALADFKDSYQLDETSIDKTAVLEANAPKNNVYIPDAPDALVGVSIDQLNSLPIGAYFSPQPSGAIKYLKVSDGDNGWQRVLPGGTVSIPKVSIYSMTDKSLKGFKLHLPEGYTTDHSEVTVSLNLPKSLANLSVEQLENIPAGTKYYKASVNKTLVKNSNGNWDSIYGGDLPDLQYTNENLENSGGLSEYKLVGGDSPAPTGPVPEKELVQGTDFGTLTPEDVSDAKIGTEVLYSSNGKLKGSYKKTSTNNWKYYPKDSESAATYSLSDEDMNFGLSSIPGVTLTVKPDEEKSDSEEIVDIPEEDPYYTEAVWFSGLNYAEGLKAKLDNEPVGSVIKINAGKTWTGDSHPANDTYYVKDGDNSWTKFKKNASKLTSKAGQTYYNIWDDTPISTGSYAVSKPKEGAEFTVTGSGEIAYVGDSVQFQGQSYTLDKILKTGLNLSNETGKVKAKPKDVTVDPTHGLYKGTDPNSSSGMPLIDFSNPIMTLKKSAEEKKKAAEFVNNFAGASVEEYNAQGLGVKAITPNLDDGLTILPKGEADPSNPLYQAPEPKAPVAPVNYPEFVAPKSKLGKWDSSKWLKKVEQRYLDNPNKAKSKVQDSNNWSAIQSVMNGEKGPLDKLLNSQYITQEMFDEAVKGIDDHEKLHKETKADHDKRVADAKARYDEKKKKYFAEYNDKYEKFTKDLEDWVNANPNPKGLDKPKLPPVSTSEFSGGKADWTKAPTGTFSGDSAVKAVKEDAATARKGLSFAVDSDKIEDFDVDVKRILDKDGVESLEYNFKLTSAYGNLFEQTMIGWGAKSVGYVGMETKSLDPDKKILKNEGVNHSFKYSTGQTYTSMVEGGKLVFQKDNDGKNPDNLNVNTNDNSVRLVMPLDSTVEDFAKVLDKMGIEAAPTTQGAIRILAENKLLKMFAKDNEAITNTNFTGEKRKQELDKIQEEFGVSIDNVIFSQEPNGKVRLFLDKDTTNKLVSDYGYNHFWHNISDTDAFVNIIAGPNPGLASTYHRWTNGIGGTGASSQADIGYGSGDYIYTTAKKGAPSDYNGLAIRPEAILSRLDYWLNMNDSFGKKSSGSSTPHQTMKKMASHGGAPYEVMPKDTIPLKDILFLRVADHIRDDVIKKVKERGVTHVNGVPVESFVLSSSTDNVPNVMEWAGVEGDQTPTYPVVVPPVEGPTVPAEGGSVEPGTGEGGGGSEGAPAAGGGPAV